MRIISYDKRTFALKIKLKAHVYTYQGVPPDMVQALRTGGAPFYKVFIKGRFPHTASCL